MEERSYLEYQEKMHLEYESRCRRCGACCGAVDNDPCVNLARDNEGLYFCRVYDSRLGPQKTLSEKVFTCVRIKENLKYGDHYSGCGYV